MTQGMRRRAAGLAVVALAMAVGWGWAADTPARKAPEKKAAPSKPALILKPGNPSAHGIREANLEGLRAVLRKAVDDKTVPGLSLLLAQGRDRLQGGVRRSEGRGRGQDRLGHQAGRGHGGDGRRGSGQAAPRRSGHEIHTGVQGDESRKSDGASTPQPQRGRHGPVYRRLAAGEHAGRVRRRGGHGGVIAGSGQVPLQQRGHRPGLSLRREGSGPAVRGF